MNKINNFGKILAVLVISYLLSSFSIENVFLANSPRIRPNLGNYLLAKVNNVKENVLARFNFNFSLFPTFNQPSVNNVAQNQTREQAIEFLKESLKPVAKGVNASTTPGYSYTEFNLDEIEWAQITYTLKDGQVVTIQYPKGTNPPPQTIYENQYE